MTSDDLLLLKALTCLILGVAQMCRAIQEASWREMLVWISLDGLMYTVTP